MKKLFADSLVSWLMTLLLSIWCTELFCCATDVRIELWILLPALALWSLSAAMLDTGFGCGAALGFLAVGEIVAFAALGGEMVIGSAAALLTGGEVDSGIVVYAVILMGAAAFAVVAMYLFRSFAARAVWCAAWVIVWIAAAVMEYELPKTALAAAAALVLMTLAEGSYRRGERPLSLRRAVTVFLAGVGAVLFVLPTSAEPYPYPILNAIVDKVEEAYEEMVTDLFFREEGEGEFTMDFAGYSEEGDVGEGYRDGGERSGLLATSRLSTDGSLYLAGNSWDTFDGREWMSTVDDDAEGLLDWNMDAAERIYALWRYQENRETAGTTAYMRAASVYIRYEGLSTRTLFTAPTTVQVTTDRERFPWDGQSGRVLFDYLQTRDTYYRVHYLETNDALFGQWAAFSDGYVYDEESDLTWLTVFGDYRPEFGLTRAVFDTNERVEPLLRLRQEKIEETYLQIPDDLSERVRELADEITAGCNSDYEKLLAIGDYLRRSHTYTASPPPVPKGTAFLDYVLFEAEAGYCTWYATAATILARCAGIPARYVQGYCAELEAGVVTELDAGDSHAWCEGYVAGLGWITLEATPGYLNEGGGWDAMPERQPEAEEPVEMPQDEPGEREEVPSMNISGAALCALLLCAVLGAAFLPSRVRRWRRYRAADRSGKVQMDLVRFLDAKVRRDFRRRGEESLRQYFGRLRWMLRLDAERMEQMTVFYEEVLFAGREATETEWKESREFLREIHKLRRGRGYRTE